MWSPDGRSIATRGGRGIEILDRRGRVLSTVRTLGWPGPVKWSPDGRRLAFAELPRAGGIRVVTASVNGGDRRVVARDAGFPDWSPDGRTIYYGHLHGEYYFLDSIWSVSSTGGRARELVPRVNNYFGLSPGGRWLLYERSSRDYEIRIARADGSGEQRDLWRDGAYLVGWAPQGLGVHLRPVGARKLRLVSIGGDVRIPGVRPAGQWLLTWSPDARHIAWVREHYGKDVQVQSSRLDGKRRRVLARFTSKPPFTEIETLEWSPDDRQLVVEAHRHIGD